MRSGLLFVIVKNPGDKVRALTYFISEKPALNILRKYFKKLISAEMYDSDIGTISTFFFQMCK